MKVNRDVIEIRTEDSQQFLDVTRQVREIVRRSGTRQCDEGCLSLPGYKGIVPRSEKVVVKGLNRDGRPVRYHATDLFAEAIEHEVDHLNGTLYFDYLESPEKLIPLSREEMEEEADVADDQGQDEPASAAPSAGRTRS